MDFGINQGLVEELYLRFRENPHAVDGDWRKYFEVESVIVRSGLDLAKRLQADDPALPIIYSSGYSPAIAGQENPLQEGINFLSKPYEQADLLRIIALALRGR